MSSGTGLVALHQASTVPPGNTTIPMEEWLGARRNGMWDRTTETVALKPFTPGHPFSAGVGAMTITDEFYSTLIFSKAGKITPILRAEVTPKFGDEKTQAATPAKKGESSMRSPGPRESTSRPPASPFQVRSSVSPASTRRTTTAPSRFPGATSAGSPARSLETPER